MGAPFNVSGPFAPPQLSTGLTAPAPAAPKADNSFSIFGWHPSLPNLGGITAAKQLISGVYGLGEDVAHMATGDFSDVPQLARGIGNSIFGVGATLGRVAGIPGTDLSLEAPIQAAGEALTGSKPMDLFELAHREGPIAALVQQVGTVAMVADPVAGMLGKAATGAAEGAATASAAAEAAAGTSEAAGLQEAAQVASARAAQLARQANVAHSFARPYSFALGKVGELAKAAGESTAAESAASATGAAESVPLPHEVAQQMADALKAQQDPVEAVASQAESEVVPSEPKVPRTLVAERGVTTGAADEGAQAIARAEEEAAPVARESSVAAKEGARLEAPTPPWAIRTAEILPSGVNRVLAHLDTPLTRFRLAAVVRDYTRIADVAQRAARNSPAVAASVTAASDILSSIADLKRTDVSRMVGEEIGAQLDGTALVDQALIDTNGNVSPAMERSLRNVARRGYLGIPKDVMNQLEPDVQTQLGQHIDTAVGAWRDQATKTRQTLLASTKGAQGLEHSLIDPTSPIMTPSQVKLYRRAMSDLRLEAKVRERIPDQQSALEAAAEKADLNGQKAARGAAAARRLVGDALRTADNLHDGMPKGAEYIERTVDDVIQGVATDGSVLYDVGLGKVASPPSGYHVNVANQFDVSLEVFQGQARQLVTEAVQFPKDHTGAPTANGIWNGTDARLQVQLHTGADGRQWVSGDIGLASVGGRPMQQWQATILGETFGQDAVTAADGTQVPMQGAADISNLSAHYYLDALDKNSDLHRVAEQLRKNATQADAIGLAEVDAELRMAMTWDYSLSRSNPSSWTKGDLFKAVDVDFGKGAPRATNWLFQTVLPLLSTNEHIDRALAQLEPAQVSAALKWYYESHDEVERMWGGKDITLLNGESRPANEVFYDLLAITSVMASPTQNLGRAMMALSNMEEFLSSRRNAYAATQKLMERLNNVPAGRGEKYALKFERIPEVRRLTEGTSMVTSPKYNVMDVLTGRLKLDQATNADIASQPEFWMGNNKGLSDVNMPRANVVERLDRANDHTPEAEAYRQWVTAHENLRSTDLGAREFKPITAAQNEDTGTGLNQSRQVPPAEFEATAQEGKQLLAQKRANASEPTGLTENLDAVSDEAWQRAQQEWGGATIDAHTGTPVADDANAYAVTTKPPGLKAISLPPGISRDKFRLAMRKALVTFHDELSMEGAHLGVFHNGATGKIEIDPVQVVTDQHAVEALGAASHAKGGAYHFQSGKGYWVPYVGNEFESRASLGRAVKESGAQEAQLLAAPNVRAAHEQALMEYHGSTALAKLRSFRSNLSDPENSLAVTLDSVMANMYGINSTDWAGGNTYGQHANEIRDAADMLSKRWGREVKPHEVQALLWVYTRHDIARQDWGRLLAHHDMGLDSIDQIEKATADGQHIDPRTFDPLNDYWTEELGYSRERLDAMARKDYLRGKAKYSVLTADEKAELAQTFGTRRSTAEVAPDRANVGQVPEGGNEAVFEDRFLRPDDARVTAQKEESYQKYLAARDDMQTALRTGNFDEARRQLTSYVVQRRRSVMGDEGGSLAEVGPKTRGSGIDSAAVAEARLQGSRFVPAPTRVEDYQLHGNLGELHERFNGHVRGSLLTDSGTNGRLTMRLFADAAIDTLAHESGHLLRQMLPTEDMAFVESKYPHITDATLTPARRVAEEQFVTDMMLFIRDRVRTGTQPPTMVDAFRRIAATFEEHHSAWLETRAGQSVPNDIAAFWTRLFHPDIERPSALEDPLNTQRVAPGGVEVKQFRWESPAEFAQRARQYGEARQAVETAQVRAQRAAERSRKADSVTRQMVAAMNGPTRAEQLADKLHGRATATLDKLAGQLEDPTTGSVSAAWQPITEALFGLRDEAKLSDEVANALGEIPQTFSQVLAFAAERGFDPTYVRDVTWERATRDMFGHMQLGLEREATSGMRRLRTGTLSQAGIADRSIAALASGMVDATKELYTNQLQQFIEKYHAQPLERGAAIPEGRVSWDAERTYIQTGTRPTGDTVATTATMTVPKAVQNVLNDMSKNYDNWAFHVLSRATSPWRTILLSLSPSWYLKHFIGSMVLTTAEGVRWADWVKAFHQWREGTMPEDVRSIHSFAQSTQAEGVDVLIPRGVKSAATAEGRKAATFAVQQQLFRVNNAMNEIARGAVYEKMLRKGFSREAALTRAYTALVDYGDLTPFERNAVRAVVPFYGFQKGILKLLLRFPSDHPLATGLLLQLGALHEEQLQDHLGGSIPDAYLGLTDIGGYRNMGIVNPFRDGVNLLTPHGIAASFNPYLDVLVRDAYNAPSPGASQQGMSPTGAKQEQVNLAAELGGQLSGLPQARLAEQLAGGGDIYGQDPGVVGGVTQFLGAPKTYSPIDLAAIAAKVRKTNGQAPVPVGG